MKKEKGVPWNGMEQGKRTSSPSLLLLLLRLLLLLLR